MKKTRFFYLKKVNVILILLWIGVINEAVWVNLDPEKEESVTVQNQEIDIRETKDIDSLKEKTNLQTTSEYLEQDVKMIRVLLMGSDYSSYYHPSVSVAYDGKEETYTMESSGLQDGNLIIECDNEGISISSIQRDNGIPTYQGTIEIRKTEKGLLVINELPVESYLQAVVPSEMPSYYEKEALKAQAVCARTYAYKQMEKQSLKEYGADVDDSVNYQVYGNQKRDKNTDEAVKETENQVLYEDGKLIEAYYFSTSSGKTSTDEIWGAVEASSYLKSVECDFDSNESWSNWSVEIPWENLNQRLGEYGINGQEITDLKINKKSESGAVTEMLVSTNSEQLSISGEYDIRRFLAPEGVMVYGQNGEMMPESTLLPSAYFECEIKTGKSMKIEGQGYGHGVGMSQNAANNMAKQGYTWKEIIHYFFKDVSIESYESLS